MLNEPEKNEEDEYQFPQDEYIPSEKKIDTSQSEVESSTAESVDQRTSSFTKKASPQWFSRWQNQRLLLIVGVIVLIVIVFKWVLPSTSVKEARSVKIQPIPTTPMNESTHLAVKNIKKPVPPLHPLSESSVSQALWLGHHDLNRLRDLQSKVTQLNTTLQQTVQKDQTLREALLILMQEMTHLSERMRAMAIEQETKKSHVTQPSHYYLRAVIPKRAWIRDAKGRSDSVAVGDWVAGYGKVRAIDVEKGRILTSSGRIIAYSNQGN